MRKLVLVGNPNAGKSTVFNKLTKSNEHTGNWGGVTVDSAKKCMQYNGKKYVVVDTPGIYGMDAKSIDEINAVREINENKDAIFLNVIDVNTLKKSLYFTLQLLSLGVRVVLVVNFFEVAKKRGLVVDFEKLSQILGVDFVCVQKGDAWEKELLSKIQNNKIRQASFDIKTADKHKEIAKILDKVVQKKPKDLYAFGRLDKIFLRRTSGIICFVLIMASIFWLTFGAVGSSVCDGFCYVVERVFEGVLSLFCYLNPPDWAISFVQAILGSVGGVLSFLPQIVLLYSLLSFLEQSGYVARMVFLFEPFFAKLGLSGKSVFGLLLGFGCTTLALPSVQTIDNDTAKTKTALLLPYITCHAKLPIIASIAAAIFFECQVLIILLMYFIGVAVALLIAFVLQKVYPTKIKSEIIEFTPLRMPRLTAVFKSSIVAAGAFLRKVGTIIFVFGIVIWFLKTFDFTLQPVNRIEDSILSQIARLIAPIFAPLGFEWGEVVALLVGIVAKEMVLSTIFLLNGGAGVVDGVVSFDICSGIAFLVFCVLYTPCISALARLYSILPKRVFVWSQIGQFFVAYIFSMIIMSIIKCILQSNFLGLIWVVIFSIVVFFVLHLWVKRKFGKNKGCKGCKFCN